MSSPLNIWDEKEQKYVPLPCLKGDKGDPAVTDQTYAPTSENAQSGKAVAEAVAPKANKTEVDKLKEDLYNLSFNHLMSWEQGTINGSGQSDNNPGLLNLRIRCNLFTSSRHFYIIPKEGYMVSLRTYSQNGQYEKETIIYERYFVRVQSKQYRIVILGNNKTEEVSSNLVDNYIQLIYDEGTLSPRVNFTDDCNLLTWEQGTINSAGRDEVRTDRIRSKGTYTINSAFSVDIDDGYGYNVFVGDSVDSIIPLYNSWQTERIDFDYNPNKIYRFSMSRVDQSTIYPAECIHFHLLRPAKFAFDNLSGKVDNLSGKVDNLSGKVDNLSGKVDRLSDSEVFLDNAKTVISCENNEAYKQLQGGCLVGKDYVYALPSANKLCRVNIFTKSESFVNYSADLDHANDMTYNPITNKIYVATLKTDGAIGVINSDTLEVESIFDIEINNVKKPIYGIAYDRKNDKYYLADYSNEHLSTDIFVFDGNFTYEKTITVDNRYSAYYQGIETDGNHIYQAYGINIDENAYIQVYDLTGKSLKVINVKKSTTDHEIENICFDWNENFYIGFTRKGIGQITMRLFYGFLYKKIEPTQIVVATKVSI